MACVDLRIGIYGLLLLRLGRIGALAAVVGLWFSSVARKRLGIFFVKEGSFL